MVKHLTKHGNSLALVIERPILELLEVGEKTPLRVEVSGRTMIVTAAPSEARAKRIRRAAEAVGRRYRKVFERLADR